MGSELLLSENKTFEEFLFESLGHSEFARGGRVLAIETDYDSKFFSSKPTKKWLEKFEMFTKQMELKGYTYLARSVIPDRYYDDKLKTFLYHGAVLSPNFCLFLIPANAQTSPLDTSAGSVTSDTDSMLKVEFLPPILFRNDKFLKGIASWASTAITRFGVDNVKFSTSSFWTRGEPHLVLQATKGIKR